jgi:hypothetical protein
MRMRMRSEGIVTVIAALLCMLTAVAPAAADAPRSLADYAILGVHRVDLGDGAFVAGGHVGVNEPAGTLHINGEVFVADGSAVVADSVSVGGGSSLFDVFTNALSGAPLVRGAGPTAFAPSIVALPALPTFAPGATPVIASGSAPVVLASGAYGAVVVGPTATLELTGGQYDFARLSVHAYGSVIVDAPVTINIQGNVKISAFGNLGPASGTVAAGDVRVNVGGTFVRVERTAHIGMDLFAPLALLRFGRSVRAEGRFVGDEFVSDETLNLRLVGAADTAPASELCTFAQNAYGLSNSGTNPVPALVVQPPAILPVTVGAPGISSLTILDAAGLTCFLPTHGTPASLYLRLPALPGDTLVDACRNPPIVDFAPDGDGSSGGLGGGALVGEVIAAKLNVALSDHGTTPPGLASFVLPTRLCTTNCPRGRVVNPNPMKFQTGAVGVADGQTTVAGLLAFADQALSVTHCRAGTCTETNDKAVLPPNPIRLSDIENALRAVNECFQGCATLIPCDL